MDLDDLMLSAIRGQDPKEDVPIVSGLGHEATQSLSEAIACAIATPEGDRLLLALMNLDIPEGRALRDYVVQQHVATWGDELELIRAERRLMRRAA